MQKLGSLWKKQGKNGKFLSGVITLNGVDTNILIFTNTHKQKETHPDYNILLSEGRRQGNNMNQHQQNQGSTQQTEQNNYDDGF